MKTFQLAINTEIIAKPGDKPDFGLPGTPKEQLTPKQRRTRSSLTYRNQNVELTAVQIGDVLAGLGGTIMGQHEPSRANKNFKAAQFVGIDFDQLTSASEVLDHPIVKAYGSIIYYTVSSKPGKPKMRVILLLDIPITDPVLQREVAMAILWKFEGKGDEACKDLVRLFFGCKGTDITVTDKVLPLAVLLEWVAEWRIAKPEKARRTKAKAARSANTSEATENHRDDTRPSTRRGVNELKKAQKELKAINTAGQYYQPLNDHAFRMGTLVGGGFLNYNDAYQGLVRATSDWPAGAGGPDKQATIRKALGDGEQQPFVPEPTTTQRQAIPVDTKVNSRYMPDVELKKKITLVRCYKGGGKSAMVARMIAGLPASKTVMSIGHRVALLEELSRRWGLDLYLEFKRKNGVDEMDKSNRVAVCADSLTRFSTAETRDLIVIDEGEQVLKHFCGSTIKKRRQSALAMFRALLKSAEKVLVLDADLGPTTYNFFKRLVGAENIEVVENEYQRTDAPPMLSYDSKEELTQKLFENIEAGVKCYVATSSKEEALNLERDLKKKFPELRVLCITQKNSAAPEIRMLLKNLKRAVLDYDVLIASPTLGTGIDLSIDHFQETFVFGFHHTTTHSDLLQHAARNRKAKTIHAWIAPGETFNSTDPAYYKQLCIDRAIQTGIAIDYDEQTKARIAASHEVDFLELWGDVKATEAESRNNLADNFYGQAREEGHKVTAVNPPTAQQTKELEEIHKLRVATENEREEERIQAVEQARDITELEAQDLERKFYVNPTEEAEKEKHRIQHFYGLTADRELIEIDNKGKFMGRLEAYMMHVGQIDPKERDRKRFDNKEYMLTDARHYARATDMRQTVLEKFFGNGIEAEFSKTSLLKSGVIKWVLDNREDIKRDLNVKVKSDFTEKPVELVAAILKQIGIQLKNRRPGKRNEKAERLYRIDNASVETMNRLATARLAMLIAKEAAQEYEAA